jgi:hypothetical protein
MASTARLLKRELGYYNYRAPIGLAINQAQQRRSSGRCRVDPSTLASARVLRHERRLVGV